MIRGHQLLLVLDFIRYVDELHAKETDASIRIENPRGFLEAKVREALTAAARTIEDLCTNYPDWRARAHVYFLSLRLFLTENAHVLAVPDQSFSIISLLSGVTGIFVREPIERLLRLFASGEIAEEMLKEPRRDPVGSTG